MVDKTAAQVVELMLAKLKQSSITEKEIKTFKITPFTKQQCMAKFPEFSTHVEGFSIPYFDIQGKQTKFLRYRTLGKTSRGLRALLYKDQRYFQITGTLNELYFPPNLAWKKIASDTKKSLIITEGELKAICGALHGLSVIGLGGVWCFRSAKKNIPLLPQFSQIDWKERTVYICYDSDAVSNPDVAAAENMLSRELTNKGAHVFIVRIPSSEAGKKIGLDDYIVEHGVAEFQKLLVDAMEWEQCKELHEMNEKVLYVRDPGFIVRMDKLKHISPRAFVEHAFSTHTYRQQQTVNTANGSTIKLVEKSAAKEWLKWNFRNEVESVTYEPGKPRIVDNKLNYWPGWGVEPIKGNMKLWHEFMDYLFKGDKAARKWVEQWFAYPMQYPGTKMYTTVVVWGTGHGTGKSFLGYMIKYLYGLNGVEIMDDHLMSTYNEWAANKQFVMGDEIAGGDKRHSSDKMKSIITRKELRVNMKYVPSYSIVDIINYYFTSNHPDAFFVEDKDRRYFIHNAPDKPLSEKFYHTLHKWFYDEGGAQALFYYLLHLDLTGFDPRAHAPMTESKEEMIRAGKSDIGSWVQTLKEDPDSILRMDNVVVKHELWTAQELHAFYDPRGIHRVTANGLSRELRRAEVPRAYAGHAIPTATGWKRLWIIRNEEHWSNAKFKEIAEHYDSERDPSKRKKYR